MTICRRSQLPLIAVALFSLQLHAAQTAGFIESQAVPGGIVTLDLGPGSGPLPTASWNGKPIAVLTDKGRMTAVVGIPLSAEIGPTELTVVDARGKSRQLPFTIDFVAYEEQRLIITNKRKVNPAPLDMERINRENKRLKEVKSYRADRLLATSFDWPLAGPVSSNFGLRRFYNNQARRPHGGIDIAAPEGALIIAPADGLVIETGDYFFNGNSVFLEHGLGLQSFYAHMSRIDVRPGERVSQGQVLGAVGKTGRVTGPHLHWSIGLNGTWVNPLLVLADDAPPEKREAQ